MREITIDSILRDHYNAISSDKLSDDNINIDENLVVEDSKNKYLQAFAQFLNDAYMNNYKISDSIISKLMNIIEYDGYQYQIIKEYIRILIENMDWEEIPNSIQLTPTEAIEYINLYLSMGPDNVAYYTDNHKFATIGITNRLLIEIDDPMKLINEDFKQWEGKYRKLCDIAYFYYKYKYNLYYAAFRGHRNRLLMAMPLLEEEDIEKFDALIQQDYSISNLATILEMYYKYNELDLPDSLPEIVNRNIRRLIELRMFNTANEQLALEISDSIELWRRFNENNDNLGINTLDCAINIYDTWPDRYNIYDDIDLIDRIISKYPEDVYFYARQILLDMNYDVFCYKFVSIFSKLDDRLRPEERDSLVSECVFGLVSLKNEEVNIALQNLYDNLIKIHDSGKTSYIPAKHIADIMHDSIVNIH